MNFEEVMYFDEAMDSGNVTHLAEFMFLAARRGDIETMKRCRERGVTQVDIALGYAAIGGQVGAMELCKKWGATNFDLALVCAAEQGHIKIAALCKKWGATDFDEALISAVEEEHIEIAALCRRWLGFDHVHHELLRYHHKRKFYRKIAEELLPVAWHPDRVYDWCFDEEEKGFLEEMWKN